MKGGQATEQLGPSCCGRAVPYLNMRHPEEANVEHAIGHEARQIQGNEVEAQTNNTVQQGDGEKKQGRE